MYSLNIGGVERSLIGLLETLNYKNMILIYFYIGKKGILLILFLKKSIYYQ